MELARLKNCGMLEMNGLCSPVYFNNPLKALQAMLPVLKNGVTWPSKPDHSGAKKGKPYSFILFTAAYQPNMTIKANMYGHTFAEYIEKHELGTVVTLPKRTNWTTYEIQPWLWAPDYDKLYAHLDANSVSVSPNEVTSDVDIVVEDIEEDVDEDNDEDD